jgi:hypothetical protein
MIVFLAFLLLFVEPGNKLKCKKAFSYKTDDYAVAHIVNICQIDSIPEYYEATLNIPVCDDKLCAPVFVKIKWDLAGNYLAFDTIAGKPLTKFDHKRFSDNDYRKLDQILKDKNSILQSLSKTDLIDKSVQVKATTVDAVTGATPATIKQAVVEGAVYSSFTLWHFVNGTIGDSLRTSTLKNYSPGIAFKLLDSKNFETQLFALKQFKQHELSANFERLLPLVEKSSPLVRAYFINKLPLPFPEKQKNRNLLESYKRHDAYSKSIFIDRIISDKEIAAVFAPLILDDMSAFDEKQQQKLISGVQKLGIQELNKQIKEYFSTH